MKLINSGLVVALLLAPAFARAEDKGTTKTNSQDAARTDANPMNTPDTGKAQAGEEKMTDARLVALLHHVNQDEIAAGKLAQQKGQSASIKSYGKQLVADHSKSQQEVTAAAQQAGVAIKDSALTAHDKEMMKVDKNKMDQLKRLSGAEFDVAFAQELARDHDHMVSMLRDHKGDIQSADLKQLVEKTIPVLEKHKDLAEKAEKDAGRSANQARTAPARR
jgi:putative membrane protein